MDAISVLKKQHSQVATLFTEFETTRGRQEDVVQQICQKLTIHDKIERDLFYPAVIQLNAEIGHIILESLEEHHLVQVMLKQLADIDASDKSYEAKVTVLKELVQHHVREEETELFKMVREVVDEDTLNRLGRQMTEATDQLQQQEPRITITMLDEVKLETPRLAT
jgi:hemerythrin superfamily protein